MGTVRIGTRGSPLALKQAETVLGRLADARPNLSDRLEIVKIRTSGDRIQDRCLAESGGKGLFTKEIERALMDGEIDMAVHSMKDVPTFLPEGLRLAAFLPREDVRDMWISTNGQAIDDMPKGFRLGSASVRRQAQIRARRPDLELALLRGNVETRLRKVQDGDVDATLLACAGLNRLGLTVPNGIVMEVEDLLPAAAQGIVGIEIREDDTDTASILADINDAAAETAVHAERAFLACLDGSCRSPIAAYAQPAGNGAFVFRGEILSESGNDVFRIEREGKAADMTLIATDAAEALKVEAGDTFMKAFLAGPR